MTLRRPLSVVLFTLALFPAPGLAQEGSGGLILQPGDAVRLEIGTEPGLGGEFRVGEDGKVLLPLVGFLPAAGLPFAEVRDAIRGAYVKELRDAQVAVTPIVRVAVLGEVRMPGLIAADPTLTLAEIVASAGGLAPEADPDRVTVTQGGANLSFSLVDGSAAGYRIRSGDQIVVGRRSWVALNQSLLVTTGASILTALLTVLLLR